MEPVELPPPPPPQSSRQVEDVMVSVTGTEVPVALEELNWIEPLYVPAAMRPGVTLTVTEPGALPLPGVTLSHEPPEAEAVKDTLPLESDTVSF